MNVDQAEIAKFREMAAHWWDRNGECRALHDINPLRLGYIAECARLEGATVLDVGCGGGILSEAMAACGARVTGIDMGKEMLAAAALHARESGYAIDYCHMSAEEMAARHPGAFDVVTCMELLEHVPDPASVVRACGQMVRPGGSVFFATLNRNFKSFVFAIIGAEYVLRLLAPRTHRHSKFVRPAELAGWGSRAGLSVRDLTGLQYNPFTRRYFLNRDTSVNYMAHLTRQGAEDA
ncbi:bifunctional 3-demethylubiquinol 3-O-methyltrans ferase/2-polyprenyl-6-hydroxyphenol methylase [Desulfonema ishimotonii]|uniref:Bifunctional 3-demethylubiquinol 3-O-methyltrans ferase/2-polyprenyl-6-hydroxyphenol methylase n=1 Tax=Desulfonema ishimotonii TaxID=45657 RepID=A0A401FRZ6_9BACT|nr:bifunctional 2-polyprenyl-6-hydroxyphenol methylase/3-demethylubiquinol 3-O-methyltransferase UbiG [Desulfonema ishimotonii]GBC59741.1 bifunctional 3-demethylubiquinol 3-O-methyltrans ferase/2-polyprenyl-6-hydroxyphenol methylase [Desulfonema ishimotonii]